MSGTRFRGARLAFLSSRKETNRQERVAYVTQELILCFLLLWAAPLHAQPSEDWLPLTQHDLQLKDVPGDPGAGALQLYYADFRDDVRGSEFIYQRIKILNQDGMKYANVAIAVPEGASIVDLKARTIHADGATVDFTGRPSGNHANPRGGLATQSFTLPNVSPGSILEYKYRLSCEHCLPPAAWLVQHDLFTVEESFWLRPSTAPLEARSNPEPRRLSYVASNLPPGAVPKDTPSGIEMRAENVPPFEPEPHMPPEANFQAQVQFFYGGQEIDSPEAFWQQQGRAWYSESERFMGDYPEIKHAAADIAGGETDAQKKLMKIHDRVQQIRNLDYYSVAASSNQKPNESVLDVWTHGYGSQNEIAELFTALARAAGFQADLLRASSREEKIFDPKLLSKEQLAAEIVRVRMDGSDLFLDPSTKFCPFGLVAWMHTSVPALLLNQNGGTFVVVPTATADKNVIHRNAEVELKPDGSLEGEITIEFKGNDALQHRLDALGDNEARRRQNLEAELRSWLPPGSIVQLNNAQNWESTDDPLVAHFSFRLGDFGRVAGKHLTIPANLFRSELSSAFRSTERRYPVYFPYTFEQIDKVSMHIPGGYSPTLLPNGRDTKLASARLVTTRLFKENQLQTTRALVVNSIYFQPQEYPSLTAFFNKLRDADGEAIVFSQGTQP